MLGHQHLSDGDAMNLENGIVGVRFYLLLDKVHSFIPMPRRVAQPPSARQHTVDAWRRIQRCAIRLSIYAPSGWPAIKLGAVARMTGMEANIVKEPVVLGDDEADIGSSAEDAMV